MVRLIVWFKILAWASVALSSPSSVIHSMSSSSIGVQSSMVRAISTVGLAIFMVAGLLACFVDVAFSCPGL